MNIKQRGKRIREYSTLFLTEAYTIIGSCIMIAEILVSIVVPQLKHGLKCVLKICSDIMCSKYDMNCEVC